jgi:hypothetical protein
LLVNKKIKMTILAYPTKPDEIKSLKGILKALNIPFEISPYSPEFVAKIKKGENEIQNGDFITLDPKNIWGSILSK